MSPGKECVGKRYPSFCDHTREACMNFLCAVQPDKTDCFLWRWKVYTVWIMASSLSPQMTFFPLIMPLWQRQTSGVTGYLTVSLQCVWLREPIAPCSQLKMPCQKPMTQRERIDIELLGQQLEVVRVRFVSALWTHLCPNSTTSHPFSRNKTLPLIWQNQMNSTHGRSSALLAVGG